MFEPSIRDLVSPYPRKRWAPPYFDAQQVCLNGHQITDSYRSHPELRKEFCKKCGAQTLHQCPSCKAEIQGYYRTPGAVVLGVPTSVPTHCHNCGEPYPWASKGNHPDDNRDLTVDALKATELIADRFHSVALQFRSRNQGRKGI